MRRTLLVTLLLPVVLVASASASHAAEAEAADYFTAREIAASEQYRDRAYVLSLGASALGLVVVALLGLGRGSRALARWSRRRFDSARGRTIGLVFAVSVIPALIVLPLRLGKHQHDRSFGLATNTPAEFLQDEGLNLAVQAVIFLIAAGLLVALARRLPRAWPFVAAPMAAGLTIALVLVFPLVVEPLFNTFTPADQRTRARVVSLADDLGVPVGDVLVSDASRRTTALNAYVSGLGATKRVVLFDTLLAQSPPDEVDVVVAHELAHQAHNDVLKGTVIAAAGTAVAVIVLWLFLGWPRFRTWIGADGPGDPAIVPFLALFIAAATVLTAPAASAYSRSIEADADRAALAVTSDPEAMINLQVRLARENLSDLSPPAFIEWAFFTHPSTLDRIDMALAAQDE